MIPTPHKVTVMRGEEVDVWGDVVQTESFDLDANVRSRIQVVTSIEGKEVVSNFTVLFVGLVGITEQDEIRFTEPNGMVVTMQPISVKFMRDLDGSVGYTKAVL